jgi:hypothetical protein
VLEYVESQRATLEKAATKSRARNERLLAHALFVALTAVPVAIATRNSLKSPE